MRDPEKARVALERAESFGNNELLRSLWLAMAADHAVKDRATLVGGAAVNLHTGSYRPTDVDLCAFLGESDRESLTAVGFHNIQGGHFSYKLDDGEIWLVEFPDSQVDGDIVYVELESQHSLSVIRRESLIVDRVLQATDGTTVTFDEALRLCLAVYRDADYQFVNEEIRMRDSLEPGLGLAAVFDRLMSEVRLKLAVYEQTD